VLSGIDLAWKPVVLHACPMRPESRIGTEIAGYRIEALIGQGGMGEVYLAEHQTLGRMEALKVLSGDLSTDEGFRKRFQREARLAASLRHPNIIPVYSAGESNGSLYLVMPYIRGTDLRRLIDERKQLDPEQTLRILDGVASALDAAHAEGLVHRDVKPANILIEARDGHVYLTDFGVTRHMDSKTQLTPTGRFMGTLHYVAPEQIEG
jgi:serine/threonine protein kinase